MIVALCIIAIALAVGTVAVTASVSFDVPEPGTVPGCPAWCEGGHDAGDMHYRAVGRIQHGTAWIEVDVRYQPDSYRREPPLVMVSAWGAPDRRVPGPPSVMVAAPWAENLAGLLAVLGHADLAGLVRQAVALIGRPQP